ncbi:MAG: B12-binding domain-containing radical SAM protein [Lachnospiraceae bacterium]
MKIRFIEPGNRPYKKSFSNYFIYDKYIRTPSNGMLTLATIVKTQYQDVFCYSESISKVIWEDVLDADLIIISIFTFNANRGYELADYIRQNSKATILFGGLHATLHYSETIQHCDYVLRGEGDETILKVVNAIGEGQLNPEVPGLVYKVDGKIVMTDAPTVPVDIDTIPDHSLLYDYDRKVKYSTIWPQVHASRGCPHSCDYCALVAAFGRKVRVRSVEAVIQDIQETIAFFNKGSRRLAKMLWITDDNFFADRDWAIRVLKAMIEHNFTYHFTVQVRYEVGFDDEMLTLLQQAGFTEVAMGIEFLEDEAFKAHNKKSTYDEILRSVKNIQTHGIRVRGLFIFGAENHKKGIGEKLARFVIENQICGVLIQSMYFIPGTKVYEAHKETLLEQDNWSRCVGKVVHYPQNISPVDLQKEIMIASSRIYSFKRLVSKAITSRGIERLLFAGEFFWQYSVRRELTKDLIYLRKYENGTYKEETFNEEALQRRQV